MNSLVSESIHRPAIAKKNDSTFYHDPLRTENTLTLTKC